MLAAEHVVLAYVYISVGSYICAVLLGPNKTLWPSAIGADYPSRPMYQIGMACAVLPHIAFLGLWYIKLRSKFIGVAGLARFWLTMLSVYITRADSASTNGMLEFFHTLCEIIWMIAITTATRKTSKNTRKRIFVIATYIALFVLGIQQLTRFLTSGYGHQEFETLRGVVLLLGLYFDYLSEPEFAGIKFNIEWVRSFSA